MLLQKKINVSRFLCVLLFMLSISAVGFCADAPPLPTNIDIMSPGPNVPEELARLFGKWVGLLSVEGKGYNDSAEHVLIVEKIDDLGIITVIYARGDYPSLKWYPPGWWGRYKALWSADTKELKIQYLYNKQYATISYKLGNDETLVSTGQWGAEIRKGYLRKE